jgi:hypothetical protein
MIGLLEEMPLPSASLEALVYQQRLYPLSLSHARIPGLQRFA